MERKIKEGLKVWGMHLAYLMMDHRSKYGYGY